MIELPHLRSCARRSACGAEDADTASSIDPVTGQVWVYVTGESSNTVSVIDVAAERVVSTFLVDSDPRAVAFSPDGRFAFVTSEVGGSVARVDARRHRVLSRARVGSSEEKPVGVVVLPDGKRVYLVTRRRARTGGARHCDAARGRTRRRRASAVALSPDGRFAYSANGLTDNLSVVALPAMKVVQTVRVGTRPWRVAVVSWGQSH
jgi:YVTN family beta-propeller protein